MEQQATVGDGGSGVKIVCGTGEEDGALIVFIETDAFPKGRVLRVYVNDGAVYSAHVEKADHNTEYIADYIDEVNSLS